ncbi:hypothetical protein J6590_000206 [Homalodisca vitripennis]|nr:hypothetical protein J6590_000206 [Homalodisca vitripennis]
MKSFTIQRQQTHKVKPVGGHYRVPLKTNYTLPILRDAKPDSRCRSSKVNDQLSLKKWSDTLRNLDINPGAEPHNRRSSLISTSFLLQQHSMYFDIVSITRTYPGRRPPTSFLRHPDMSRMYAGSIYRNVHVCGAVVLWSWCTATLLKPDDLEDAVTVVATSILYRVPSTPDSTPMHW